MSDRIVYNEKSLFSYQVMSGSCDTMDCNLAGSFAHGSFQVRKLEWIATSHSRGSSWPRNWTHVSCLASEFFATEPPQKSNVESKQNTIKFKVKEIGFGGSSGTHRHRVGGGEIEDSGKVRTSSYKVNKYQDVIYNMLTNRTVGCIWKSVRK